MSDYLKEYKTSDIVTSNGRDMSKQWGKGAYLIDLHSESGGNIVVRIPSKFIQIQGIDTVFDKKVITVRSTAYVEVVNILYQKIKEKVQKDEPSTAKAEWVNPVSDNLFKATLTKQTTVKYIGALKEAPNVSELEGVPFSCYAVLVIPFVFLNTQTNKVTVPIHVRTIGLMKIEDDLSGLDVTKLTLAE